MNGSPDFAFSTYGWAYSTGREGRQPRQIIRTRKTTQDSKNAGLTLLIPFEPREEQRWTEKDLVVKDVFQEELAVVVGELLPVGYCNDLKGKAIKSAKSPPFFNPNTHGSLPQAPTAGIVVKQLNHTRCALFLLHDREDGLYQKSWLPSEAKNRVVFYREWVESIYDTQEKLRTLAFNASVCKFTKAYIEQHQNDFCDLVRSTTWKAPQGELRSIAPKEAIFSYVHQAITLWNDGGEMGHLEQAYDVIMSSVGRTNWEEIQGTNDEGNWKLLQLMIEGNDNFDIREASEASRACQALWPVPADGPGSILPEALCQLARGLRAGAMLNTPIDESFYRAFITLFCAEHTAGRAQGEALHGAIQTAYYLASASVGQPLDTQEQRSTSRATDPGLLERIIHLKRAQLQSIKQLRAAEREVVMELGGTVTEIVPPNQLIQEIRSTMDINHCRELAVKLFKMSFMRHDLFAQSMVTQAATELSLLKAFWVPDDDYEDDGEGEDEDDDEAMPDASEMDEDA